MDCILLSPPGSILQRSYSLAESGYLAAVLRQSGHCAVIIDGGIEPLGRTCAGIRDAQAASLLCIILQWDHDVEDSTWLGAVLERVERSASANLVVCLTGTIGAVYHRHLMAKYPRIDMAVLGPGPETVREMAGQGCIRGAPCTVHGVAYRALDSIVSTQPGGNAGGLDQLPFPDRDYLFSHPKEHTVVSVLTSRSCYGRCTFCRNSVSRKYALGGYSARSPESVLDEVAKLVSSHRVRYIDFCDDVFIGPGQKGRKRALDIAAGIVARGLRFRFQVACRAGSVDREVIEALRNAGLRNVLVGIESGVQSVLDRYQKDTTVQENLEAISCLRALRVNIDPLFVFFDPETTLTEVRENLQFVERAQLVAYRSSTGLFSRMALLPGSVAEERYLSRASCTQRSPVGTSYALFDARVDLICRILDGFRAMNAQLAGLRQAHLRRYRAEGCSTPAAGLLKKIDLWDRQWTGREFALLKELVDQLMHAEHHSLMQTEEWLKKLAATMFADSLEACFGVGSLEALARRL